MEKVIESIFENFCSDKSKFQINVDKPFSRHMDLSNLVLELIDNCGKLVDEGVCKVRYSLSYLEWVKLAEDIKQLAKVGFDNAATINRIPSEGQENILEFDDLLLLEWALHGKKYSPGGSVSERQLYGYEALCIIDEAMTATIKDGLSLRIVNAVSLAGYYLSEAKESEMLETLLQRGVSQELIETTVKELKLREARSGGLAKSAKYEPLRKYSRDLALKGCYPSKRQASKKIKSLVLQKAKDISVMLSEENAERQIGEWLSGMTFTSRRTTLA